MFGSFSFAQESIRDVTLSFCNEGTWNLSTRYNIMVEPWEKKDVCIYVENKSDQDIKLVYSFPRSVFSAWWNQLCGNDNDFARFFESKEDRSLIVPKKSFIMFNEVVNPPVWSIGMFYGCLTYNLWTPEVSAMGGGMFNMVVRKANFLNLFVGSEDSISNTIQLNPVTWSLYSSNKNIWAIINEDGDLIVNFMVKNNGNLTQNVSLSGKLYNPLGFEKPFDITAKKLLPGDEYQASVNLGIVPFYKGLFSVRVSLFGNPVFEFDATGIDEKYKQPIVIKETWSLFIFSWFYVILALIILGLIVKVIVPKKKKA